MPRPGTEKIEMQKYLLAFFNKFEPRAITDRTRGPRYFSNCSGGEFNLIEDRGNTVAIEKYRGYNFNLYFR